MPEPTLIYSWPYVEWGGAQTYLLDIARRASGFGRCAVLPQGSSPTLLAYLSELAVPCEFVAARMDFSSAASLWRRLRRRLRNQRAERAFGRVLHTLADRSSILHVDLAPWNSHRLLGSLARHAATFLTLHTRLPEVPAWRQRLWRTRLRRLVELPGFHLMASNRDCRDSLLPYLGEAVCGRVPVAYPLFEPLPQQLDDEGASRRALCLRLGLPADRLLVVVTAQFIERKGCWTFLEAAARLVQRDPRLFFVWLGTEGLSAESAARIAGSPAAASFSYLPSRLTGASRPAFLDTFAKLADIFVLPSVIEGLPLALGEAMAFGKPVVASRINAIPEAVCHDVNGLLVPPLDAQALADAIGRLAGSPELRRRLGEAARATIETRFDERATVAVTLAAYERAVRPNADGALRL